MCACMNLWSLLCAQEQYIFLHDAMLESVTCGNTQITAADLRLKIKKYDRVEVSTGLTTFQSQFNVRGGGGGGRGGERGREGGRGGGRGDRGREREREGGGGGGRGGRGGGGGGGGGIGRRGKERKRERGADGGTTCHAKSEVNDSEAW